jgi:putative MFS transporter
VTLPADRAPAGPPKPAAAPPHIDDAPLNGFHVRLAIYSGGGPFLDGYVLSIVGVALVQATPQLGLSPSWQGLVGASALIGIFFGGFVGGWLADRFGRQVLYTLDLSAIILCSAAQYWSETAWSLFLWRLLIGVAVGADYPIASSLLAEFTPRRYRGPLVGGLIAIWFLGAAVAYVLGQALLQAGPDGWRWMLASAALPALCFVVMRHGTPESPRWLAQQGRHEEAGQVLARVYGAQATAPEAAATRQVGATALFQAGYGSRIAFVSLFWTCSVVPIFAVYAFGPKILGALGLAGDMGNYGAAFITMLFLLGCVVALRIINRLGRRALILHSFFWSGLALLLLGLFPDAPALVILGLFSAYALFIGGTQVLTWIYPNELFPTEIRGTAVGLASSLSRIGAAIGTYLVPVSLDAIGIGPTMLVAAAVTFAGFVVSLKAAPETGGLGLERSAAL